MATLPMALVRSTYRRLLRHAGDFDTSAARRSLLSANPTRVYMHEYEQWVDVERSKEWDQARITVDEYVRQSNEGRELYLPPLPSDAVRAVAAASDGGQQDAGAPTSGKTLKGIVQSAFRSRPNTAAAMSEAFSAVKLFSSAHERAADLPSEPPFPPNTSHGFRLTDVGLDGEWANPDAEKAARLLVASPLLPGIFSSSIVCMMPPPTSADARQRSGATGFIINRPLVNEHGVPVPVWAAFPPASHSLFTHTLAHNVVMIGGPVSSIDGREQAVIVVHKYPDVPEAFQVAPGVWSQYRELDALEERIKADENFDPKDVLVVVGYAGWGTSQLGGEIQHGSWLVADRVVDPESPTSKEEGRAIADYVTSFNVVERAPTLPKASSSDGAESADSDDDSAAGVTPQEAAAIAAAMRRTARRLPGTSSDDNGGNDDEKPPTTENPGRGWCEIVSSFGPEYADLTRLHAMHREYQRVGGPPTW